LSPRREARFNRVVAPRSASLHRLAPAVVARLVGVALVGLALLLLGATAVVALMGRSTAVLVVTALLAAGGCGLFAWWLGTRAWVLAYTDAGYRVRLVRGAGVSQARWSDVEEVVANYRHHVACLELRLRDGGTTTIPVGLLAVDRDELARALRRRLGQGHGLAAD
jgi:hypothetical protein